MLLNMRIQEMLEALELERNRLDAAIDALNEEYRIEMIAPNRENRSKTQDGRALRRYLPLGGGAAVRLAALVPQAGCPLRISC